MSPPRAVGVRAPWTAAPPRVRDWVERELGSPVVEAHDQVGGMSPGCATRLVTADGDRAFVKAVGTDLNPDTPTLFRREVLVLGLLGRHDLWAPLISTYDDGDWVALLLEDVEGRTPDLADDAVMSRLVDATDELARVVRERVPRPPAADPDGGGLNDLRAGFRRWAGALDGAADIPGHLLPGWVLERAGDLATDLRRLADEPMDHLVHWDVRNDNLIERPDGSLVFVDWGQAARGPDWVDPLLARLERVETEWFDVSLATSPPLARIGDAAVTAWLAGFGTFLAWRAHTAVDINLPTLAAFRRAESARALRAVARRLGLPDATAPDLGG